MSHTKKTPILWLILNKRNSILWAIFEEKFNSLSLKKKKVLRVKVKRVQLFESCFCLKVIFSRRFHSSNQIFSKKKNFASFFLRKKSILWVVIFWKEFNVLTIFQPKIFKFWVRFKKRFDSLSQVQKKKVQVFEQFSRRFNSSSHYKQSFQFFASYSKKKDSILCVIFKDKGFNSLRRIQRKKGSILCVVFKEKRVPFFASHSK